MISHEHQGIRTNLVAKHRCRTHEADDSGLTLVELIVAFTALIVLFTITATAITAYLSISNTVIGSYSTNDQLLRPQS